MRCCFGVVVFTPVFHPGFFTNLDKELTESFSWVVSATAGVSKLSSVSLYSLNCNTTGIFFFTSSFITTVLCIFILHVLRLLFFQRRLFLFRMIFDSA